MRANASVERWIQRWLFVIIYLSVLLFFCTSKPLQAAISWPTQIYYVPMPEDQIFSAFQSLTTEPDDPNIQCMDTLPIEPVTTYLSIVPSVDGSIIYYDHWEDGFDSDILNPASGSTTAIWGDGDLNNGFLLAYPTDVFSAGDVIVLKSQLQSRAATPLTFDGGDKIATDQAISMSRASWAEQSNPSKASATDLAGAVEMYDTAKWGTEFDIPIQKNNSNFEYIGLFVMASEDSTDVFFNNSLVTILDQGESYLIESTDDSGVDLGGVLRASAPVQVNMINGDICKAYESRWHALFANEYLSNSYYTPVSTPPEAPARVFLYNPNSFNIVVERTLVDGSIENISVGAGQSVASTIPYTVSNGLRTGASFISTDGSPFSAVTAVLGAAHDWGFTLIPKELLTPRVSVGLGIGQSPIHATTENGSPVWITPIISSTNPNATTTIVIDYDNDGLNVITQTLRHLESYQIFDPDMDQTGALIYVDMPSVDSNNYVQLAAAWGQDPTTASESSFGLDLGTTLAPAPIFMAQKGSLRDIDSDQNGQTNPGDTLLYSLEVANIGAAPIIDVIITDTLPSYLTYIPNSTQIDSGSIITLPDDDPPHTSFPLDEAGYTLNLLQPNTTITLTFGVTIGVLPEDFDYNIINTANIGLLNLFSNPQTRQPVTVTPAIEIETWTNGQDADTPRGPSITIGQPVTWTYVVSNTGHTNLTPTVTDNITGVVPQYMSGDDGDGLFSPNEIWYYSATGLSTIDQYANIGSARAIFNTTTVTDSDPSHYFGAQLSLEVEKTASVGIISQTTDVDYTYIVTNTGNMTLTPTLHDNLCEPITRVTLNPLLPNGLDIGEAWQYQCRATVSTDLTNTVTVSGTTHDNLVAPAVTDSAFVDRLPTIQFQKSVTPTSMAEPGGLFTYTFSITNTSPETVTIVALTDDYSLAETECKLWIGSELASNESQSCAYPIEHTTVNGYTNSATIIVADDEENTVMEQSAAIAQILDALPSVAVTKKVEPLELPEPGGLVTYTLNITNTSTEPITVTQLTDTYPLSVQCLSLISTTLAAGEATSCLYNVEHITTTLGIHENLATVTVQDDEGNSVQDDNSDDDNPPLTILDAEPSFILVKDVFPFRLNEGDGVVTYTLTLTNTSAEPITITQLTDTYPLSDECLGWIDNVVMAGQTQRCIYTTTHGGPGLYSNQVTIGASDDDGNTITDTVGSTPVTVLDAMPNLSLVKIVTPTTIAQPGGIVTYTILITNTSAEPITIAQLNDTYPLSDECLALVGTSLSVGQSTSCQYNVEHTTPGIHENEATVLAKDDEENQVQADNSGDGYPPLTVLDAVPTTIALQKRVTPTLMMEPGGTFTYTLTLINTSLEGITITQLSDTYPLSQGCLDLVDTALSAGQSASCLYNVEQTNAGSYENQATATAEDENGNEISDLVTQTVTVEDVLPSITIAKQVTPTELAWPGGIVTYTLMIANTSAEMITITQLTDTYPLSDECLALVGTPLAIGASAQCIYNVEHVTDNMTGTTVYENDVEITVTDDEGNSGTDDNGDDDFPPVTILEPENDDSNPDDGSGDDDGGDDGSGDDGSGDDGSGDDGSGDDGSGDDGSGDDGSGDDGSGDDGSGDDGSGDDGSGDDGSGDDGTGNDTEIDGLIQLTKDVFPDQMGEPGGLFTYRLMITNTSATTATLTSLEDSYTLSPECLALINSSLSSGEMAQCFYQVEHNESGVYDNQVTLVAENDNGEQTTVESSATAEITDTLPTVELAKIVFPERRIEPGGTFTYTLYITNTSGESVTITALTDDYPLSAECIGLVTNEQQLAAGEGVHCTYSVEHIGEGIHANAANVTVTDDEGNSAEDDNSDDDNPPAEVIANVLAVTKEASVATLPEPGGTISFTIDIENVGQEPLTLVALVDDMYGDLNGRGSCIMTQTLAAGERYGCAFKGIVSGEIGDRHTNVVVATAHDPGNTYFQAIDDATVMIHDALPEIMVTKIVDPVWLPEPGGPITFTVSVENRSAEVVTVTSLVDDIYGPLHGQGNCTVPQTLAVHEIYFCNWTVELLGDPEFTETNHVTAEAQDRTGNVAPDEDDATVSITNVPSSIEIVKLADRQSVIEAGEVVTFQVHITNTSPADTVTIDSLLDSTFGDLAEPSNLSILSRDCTVGHMLAVGERYECAFTALVIGQPGDVHQNTVTVLGTDDDGVTLKEESTVAIDIEGIPPVVKIYKRTESESVEPPGADVTFSITVANRSLVDTVTLTEIEDSVYGDLTEITGSSCTVPQTLEVDEVYRCAFTGYVSGEDGDEHINTVTLDVIDDDGVAVQVQDSETVPVIGVTRVIPHLDAQQESVPESGGVVDFTVVISNTGTSGDVTIEAIDDSNNGDVTQLSDSDCVTPQVINLGARYECTYSSDVSGNPGDVHETILEVAGNDRLDEPFEESVIETVDIHDVPSKLVADQVAIPSQIPEPGGEVQFEVTITNDSPSDVVTLERLVDDVYGSLPDLNASTCQMPQQLPIGGSYTCAFTAFIEGDAGDVYRNTVVASGLDDDGQDSSAQSTAIVTVDDLPSGIEVTKTADKQIVSEAGELVRFTVDIQNISVSDVVTLTSIIDTAYGDLAGHPNFGDSTSQPISTCRVPQVLGVGESYRCEFTALVSLADNVGNTHVNSVIVTAVDDDMGDPGDLRALSPLEDADIQRIIIADPKISAIKTDSHDDANGNGSVDPGESIDYTIVVQNSGSMTATGVLVRDVLDNNMVFSRALTSSRGEVQRSSDRSVAAEIGELGPNESVTINLETVASDAVVAAQRQTCVQNQATVSGLNIPTVLTDDPDTSTLNDSTDTDCEPTAITLSFFTAFWEPNGVIIRWVTAMELNTWGFHVYRSEFDNFDEAYRITNGTVLAGAQGGLYGIVDERARRNVSYYYWLEETTVEGEKNLHGPILLEPDGELRAVDDEEEEENQDEKREQMSFLPIIMK